MCSEDASNAFLLWICSASHANFITIEPGKFDMAGHHLLWVWPHTRQCLLMTLRYNTMFGENAALWPCMALLGPTLSDAKLARCFDGGLESWFKIPDSLFLVNLINLHLVNQIKILNACLLLSALGLPVFWFRPVQVGNFQTPGCHRWCLSGYSPPAPIRSSSQGALYYSCILCYKGFFPCRLKCDAVTLITRALLIFYHKLLI